MTSYTRQVCMASVPGGCVIAHPQTNLANHAALLVDGWNPWPKEVSFDTSADILKISFWMHNARCLRKSILRKIVKGDMQSSPVSKADLAAEAHQFFSRFWSSESTKRHHPAVVCFALPRGMTMLTCCCLSRCCQMAMILFDRIGDKLIEDQSAQIFSGRSIIQ